MEQDFSTELTLDQLYANDDATLQLQQKRYRNLSDTFLATYGTRPDFFARSPGRVNLIGEHIDYSDFSVLPMALSDKDIVIAVKARTKACRVHLANMNSNAFPKREFLLGSKSEGFVEIDAAAHEWSNYFKSGLKGVLIALSNANQLESGPVGMDCLVDGSVPSGAGVSSSSAFVCCSALATMRANGGFLTKKELTEVAITSERFVGVESGGMDQSASIFGLSSSALLIDFVPSLHVQPVPLPRTDPAPVFVVAHTMVTADKHVTAPVCYNLRVVETRLAAILLGKKVLKDPSAYIRITRLRSLMEACIAEGLISGDLSEQGIVTALDGMLQLVKTNLKKQEGYSLEDVSLELGMNVAELKEKYMSKFPVRADTFQLYRRAMHVFSEAMRVYQFKQVCEKPENENGDVLAELGRLMNESQYSCRDLFDCSCPELNELTELARSAGALGSRLTGAGWGGCTVSLVPEPLIPSFVKKIKEEYYGKRNVNESEASQFLFANKPGKGATIISE